jgi:hypothetical protein
MHAITTFSAFKSIAGIDRVESVDLTGSWALKSSLSRVHVELTILIV